MAGLRLRMRLHCGEQVCHVRVVPWPMAPDARSSVCLYKHCNCGLQAGRGGGCCATHGGVSKRPVGKPPQMVSHLVAGAQCLPIVVGSILFAPVTNCDFFATLGCGGTPVFVLSRTSRDSGSQVSSALQLPYSCLSARCLELERTL